MSEQTSLEHQPNEETPPPFRYDRFPERIVYAKDTSKERAGLRTRSWTREGQLEQFIAKLEVRMKPTTVARLKLYCDDYNNGFPLIDEVVDEAIQDWLNKRYW